MPSLRNMLALQTLLALSASALPAPVAANDPPTIAERDAAKDLSAAAANGNDRVLPPSPGFYDIAARDAPAEPTTADAYDHTGSHGRYLQYLPQNPKRDAPPEPTTADAYDHTGSHGRYLQYLPQKRDAPAEPPAADAWTNHGSYGTYRNYLPSHRKRDTVPADPPAGDAWTNPGSHGQYLSYGRYGTIARRDDDAPEAPPAADAYDHTGSHGQYRSYVPSHRKRAAPDGPGYREYPLPTYGKYGPKAKRAAPDGPEYREYSTYGRYGGPRA